MNNPGLTTVAGEIAMLDRYALTLKAVGVRSKRVSVTHAFHSPLMEPVIAEWRAGLEQLPCFATTTTATTSSISTVRMASTVDATWSEMERIASIDYWTEHMLKPVRFMDAVRLISADGITTFIEVGPHSTLCSLGRRCITAGSDALWCPSMKRDGTALLVAQKSAGMLFGAGAELRLNGGLFPRTQEAAERLQPALPLYPFEHATEEAAAAAAAAAATGMAAAGFSTSMQGSGAPSALRSVLSTQGGTFDVANFSAVRDHIVTGRVLFPAVGFVDVARRSFASACAGLGEIVFERTLPWKDDASKNAVHLHRVRDKFTFSSGGGVHCTGLLLGSDRVSLSGSEISAAPLDLDAIRARCGTIVESRAAYDQLHALGLEYGPMFQALVRVHSGDDEALGELVGTESAGGEFSDPLASMPLLDGALQTSIFALKSFSGEGNVFVPVRIGEVVWDKSSTYHGSRLFSHVRICPMAIEFNQPAGRTITVNVNICDTMGGVVMALRKVTLQRIGNPPKVPFDDWVYRTEWQPHRLPASANGELDQLIVNAQASPSLQLAQSIRLQRAASSQQSMLSRLAAGFAARLLVTLRGNAAADRAAGTPSDMPSDATLNALRRAADFPNPPATGEDLMAMAQLMKKSCPSLAVEIDAIQAVGRAASDTLRRRSPFSDAMSKVAEAPLAALESKSNLDVALRTLLATVLAPFCAENFEKGEKRVLRVLETRARGPLSGGAGICAALKASMPSSVAAGFDFLVGVDDGADALPGALRLRKAETGKSEDLTERSFDIVVTTNTDPEFLAYCSSLLTPGGWLCGVSSKWRQPFSSTVEYEHSWISFIGAVMSGAEPAVATFASSESELVAELQQCGFGAATKTVSFGGGVAFVAQRAAPAADESNMITIVSDDEAEVKLAEAVLAATTGAAVPSVHVVLRQPSMRLICRTLKKFSESNVWPLTTVVTFEAQVESAIPANADVIGFARCVMNEHPQWNLRLADFSMSAASSMTQVTKALRELSSASLGAEREMAHREEQWLVPRQRSHLLVPRQPDASEGWCLEVTSPGRLDTAQFHATHRVSVPKNYVRIEVKAAALNFKDLMIAMGLLEGLGRGAGIGFEGSGVVTEIGADVTTFALGDEVCFIGIERCFANEVVVQAAMTFMKPRILSWEEAASIPIVFITAFIALVRTAQLEEGEKILIHSATGGLGQAAIQIAKHRGAEIYATAGTQAKRDTLRTKHGITHVTDSHSLDFATETMRWTEGAGVDVILNSLAGDYIDAGMRCLTSGGRFVEVGKRDISEGSSIGLKPFNHNLSFLSVQLDQLMLRRPQIVGEIAAELVPLFESGDLKPVPVTVYPMRKAGEAIRIMQAGLHTGKLVMSLDVPDAAPLRRSIMPRINLFRTDGSYLVTGGFGGLGLKMAEWLGRGGAGRVILLSRSGPQTSRAKNTIESLRLSGVDIVAESVDVCDAARLETIIREQSASGKPVRGIFHLAMVLRDGPALELSDEDIAAATKPKFEGAQSLVAAVKANGCELDFLFLASTIAALFGNADQANYAAGCAQLDALANSAHAEQPTFSVNIGSLGGVGFVASNVSVQRALKLRGLHPMQPDAFLGAIEEIIRSETLGKRGAANLHILRTEWQRFSGTAVNNLRYRSLVARQAEGGAGGEKASGAASSGNGRAVVYAEKLVDVASPVSNWCARSALPEEAVPSERSLLETVRKLQAMQMGAIDWQQYSNGIDELEQLALAYLTVAIAGVGSIRNVVDAQRQLIQRFVKILKTSGALTEDGDGNWTVDPAAIVEPNAFAQRLHREYPTCEVHILWLERTGPYLEEVIRGQRDAINLLFPAGDLDLARKIYTEVPMSKLNNSTVGELAAEVVATSLSCKRALLRVVEIGAGTGGTTSQIAPRIQKILDAQHGSTAATLEYMFTDVSEAFLNAARPRFAQYPFIDFKTLDAERDMMKQGWSLRSADLVIAANVIHATRDLRNTLTRVRRLLVHGGVLILYELTSPSHYMDATVGLTSGWWEFDDYELRPEYALLTPQQWGTFLLSVGFEPPQIFTPAMGSTKHSVVFARATSVASSLPMTIQCDVRKPWLLLTTTGASEEIVRSISNMLNDLGERTVVVEGMSVNGDAAAASTNPNWAQLLEKHNPSNLVVVAGDASAAAELIAISASQAVVGLTGSDGGGGGDDDGSGEDGGTTTTVAAARVWVVSYGVESSSLAAALAPLDTAMVWAKRVQWGGVLDVGALDPAHAARVALSHMWTESVHTTACALPPQSGSALTLTAPTLSVVSEDGLALAPVDTEGVCIVWNGTSALGLRLAGALASAGVRQLLLVSEIDAPTAVGAVPSAAPPVVVDAVGLAAGDYATETVITVAQVTRSSDITALRAAVQSVRSSALKRFSTLGVVVLPYNTSELGEGEKKKKVTADSSLLNVTPSTWSTASRARVRALELARAWGDETATATLIVASGTPPWGTAGDLASAMNAAALRYLRFELGRSGGSRGRSLCVGIGSDVGDDALRSVIRRGVAEALHNSEANASGLMWTVMSNSANHGSFCVCYFEHMTEYSSMILTVLIYIV